MSVIYFNKVMSFARYREKEALQKRLSSVVEAASRSSKKYSSSQGKAKL